jgi:two-component system sensor histidine kinase UhpB
VHNMLQRLRPGVLDELGLSIALDEYVYGWRERNTGTSSYISIAKDLGEMDDEVALAAYRIVQESLTNITRHANARRMTLSVVREKEELVIEIEDDGIGFDLVCFAGYGLAGMRERVKGLGGYFSLMAAPDKGTKISVRLPIHIEETL